MSDKHPSDAEKRAKLAELVNDIGLAMMTTVGGDGMLHARPMATAEFREPYHDLWFATDKTTAKVEEILRDGRVCVTYARPGANEWVAVSGQATLVDNRQMIHELYSPTWKAWFTGPDDPRLVLIRVVPAHAEYWDSGDSRLVVMYQLVKAAVTGKRTEPGEHEKVPL